MIKITKKPVPFDLITIQERIREWHKHLNDNDDYLPTIGGLYIFLGINSQIIYKLRHNRSDYIPPNLFRDREQVVEVINDEIQYINSLYWDKSLNNPIHFKNQGMVIWYGDRVLNKAQNCITNEDEDTNINKLQDNIKILIEPTKETPQLPNIDNNTKDNIDKDNNILNPVSASD